MMATVYVVDDDAAVRDGLTHMLEAAGMEVRAYAEGGAFLDSRPADWSGCLLLDLAMPRLNGVQVQAALNAAGCRLPILFLTGHGDVPTAVRAMQAGATDFLEKPIDGKVLLGRVRAALQRCEQEAGAMARAQALQDRWQHLSKREKQVMTLVVKGQTNKEIAQQLDISFRTVEVYRANLMRKLDVPNLTELILVAGRLDSAHKA